VVVIFFLLIIIFILLCFSRSVALDMPVRGSRYSGNACYVESDLTLRNLLGKNFYDVEVDIFCLTLRKIGVVVA
jgi:hypothetical protein